MKLKIKPEHQEILTEILKTALNVNQSSIVEHVKTLRVLVIQEKVKDINKRLCWDIFYRLVPQHIRQQFTTEVYVYANDDNIYSYLKHIIKPMNYTK